MGLLQHGASAAARPGGALQPPGAATTASVGNPSWSPRSLATCLSASWALCKAPGQPQCSAGVLELGPGCLHCTDLE